MSRFGLVCALALAGLLASAGCGPPGALEARDAWVEAPPAGRGPAGGFLTLENGTGRARTLVGATSPACERIELHRSSLENDVARMIRLDGVEIAAGEALHFAPGGLHLMLFCAEGLEPGSHIPLQLELDGGETRALQAEVRPAAAAAHTQEHHH